MQAKWFSSLDDRVFSWCFFRQHMLENIVWDVYTRVEKYRVEGRSLPTWTKTYIRELLAIWDFSLKLYTYKSAKFYLRKHEEARFYRIGRDSFLLKLSFSLHEFQFIGRHGAFAKQIIAWFMTGEKKQQQLPLLIESAKVAQKDTRIFPFQLNNLLKYHLKIMLLSRKRKRSLVF